MANEGYDPEVENRDTTGSGSHRPSSINSNSAGGNNASFSRGDDLDPVRRAEKSGGFWKPNGNSTVGSEGGASDHTQTSQGGASDAAGKGAGGAKSSTSDLRDQETDQEGEGLWNQANNTSSTKKKTKSRFQVTKKRAAIFGACSTGVVSILFGFFSISSGPLEFVHIAQLMEQFHFSNQEDAEGNRLEKIAIYLHDTTRPQNTRLGLVSNKVANKLETKIQESTGLKPTYDKFGNFTGYEAINDNDNWNGKTPEQIKSELANKYGLDESKINVSGDKVSFNPDTSGKSLSPIKTVGAYRDQVTFSRGLLGEAGLNKVSAWAGTRVLTKRAGWTFHPIQKLDAQIQTTLLKGGKKALDKAKEQFNKNQDEYIQDGVVAPADGTSSAEGTKNPDGSTGPPAQSSVDEKSGVDGVEKAVKAINPDDPSSVDSASTSIKSIAGKGVAGIGVLCVIKSLNGQILHLKETKVMEPMMRFSGQIVSLGSQIESGQDIDATQAGFFKQYLDATDSNGNVTSTWNQAASIQAEEGTGYTSQNDIPANGQVFSSTTPFSSIASIGILGPACSVLGSSFATIFSIVTAPVATIVQGVLTNEIVKNVANWLSGEPINTLASAGAEDGNYINYGSRLSADQQFASAGGVPMSSTDEQGITGSTEVAETKQFNSKGLAYRLFDPNDSRTLISRLMTNYGGEGVSEGFASLFHGFGSIFSDALKVPGELFSKVHATPQPYDYHGLQAAGFTAEQLSDPTYKDPFDNACYVVGNCTLSNGHIIPDGQGILGSSSSPNQTYINNISACFNDKVSYDGSTWQIDYTGGGTTDFYDASYPTSTCESTDASWMRIRFWIFDTQTLEGYDCSQGNTDSSDQSCQDLGYTSSDSVTTTTTTTSTGSLPSSTAQDLAKQLLPYIQKGTLFCGAAAGGTQSANCSDIQNTASGQPVGGNCQVNAISPNLLGLILGLEQQGWTLGISAMCSDHHVEGCDAYSGHSCGQSADFSVQEKDGKRSSGAAAAADEPFVNDAASLLSQTGGSFGQIQCHPNYPVLNNPKFTLFDDACSHQHIRAAP